MAILYKSKLSERAEWQVRPVSSPKTLSLKGVRAAEDERGVDPSTSKSSQSTSCRSVPCGKALSCSCRLRLVFSSIMGIPQAIAYHITLLGKPSSDDSRARMPGFFVRNRSDKVCVLERCFYRSCRPPCIFQAASFYFLATGKNLGSEILSRKIIPLPKSSARARAQSIDFSARMIDITGK